MTAILETRLRQEDDKLEACLSKFARFCLKIKKTKEIRVWVCVKAPLGAIPSARTIFLIPMPAILWLLREQKPS